MSIRIGLWIVKFVVFFISLFLTIAYLLPQALVLNEDIPEPDKVPKVTLKPFNLMCKLEVSGSLPAPPIDQTSSPKVKFSLPKVANRSHANFTAHMELATKCYMDPRNHVDDLDECFCLNNYIAMPSMIICAVGLTLQYCFTSIIVCKLSSGAEISILGITTLCIVAFYNGVVFITIGVLQIAYTHTRWPFTYVIVHSRIDVVQSSYYLIPYSWGTGTVFCLIAGCLCFIEAVLWVRANSGVLQPGT